MIASYEFQNYEPTSFEMLAQPPISRLALAPKAHLTEKQNSGLEQKGGLRPSHRFCCPATSRCLAVTGYVGRCGWKTVEIHMQCISVNPMYGICIHMFLFVV